MLSKFIAIFKLPDLRNKILFIFGVLIIFRLTASIPIPGVDPLRLQAFFEGNQLFGLINLFTGGALSSLSIAMLGLGPYITAIIIMQLLTMIFPKLKELYQEQGEQGRRRFNQYSRLLTVPLAMLQAFGFLSLLKAQGVISELSVFETLINVAVITAGTIFLMWLGELITEKKLGNGVSILIFAGIIADVPLRIGQTIAAQTAGRLPSLTALAVLAIVVIAGVVFVSEAQKNIPVSYAKRVRGRRLFGGAATYLPLRVNQAGVIPIIFALSIMLFPGMIANFFVNSDVAFLHSLATILATHASTTSPIGASIYFLLVVVFTFFYTAITFDPKNIARNLQRNGGFIPGIRPGEPTTKYLQYIINRITLLGAVFLGIIAVMPVVAQSLTGTSTIVIGGTAILIVVSVVLETMKQIEAQLVMREYETF